MEFEPPPAVIAEPAPVADVATPLLWTGGDVARAFFYSLGFGFVAMVVIAIVLVVRKGMPGGSLPSLDLVDMLIVFTVLSAPFLAASLALLRFKRYTLADAGFGSVSAKQIVVWLGWAVAGTLLFTVIALGLYKCGLPTSRHWKDFAPGGFSWLGLIVMTLNVGLAAPFYEEFFFRGMLFRWLRDTRGFWLAAIVSSFLFGLSHFDPLLTSATFFLGMMSAWAYQRTESLWPCFLLHAVNNAVRVVGIYVALALDIKME